MWGSLDLGGKALSLILAGPGYGGLWTLPSAVCIRQGRRMGSNSCAVSDEITAPVQRALQEGRTLLPEAAELGRPHPAHPSACISSLTHWEEKCPHGWLCPSVGPVLMQGHPHRPILERAHEGTGGSGWQGNCKICTRDERASWSSSYPDMSGCRQDDGNQQA